MKRLALPLSWLVLAAAAPWTWADIPEPPVVLFGQFGDADNALEDTGALTVTLSPAGGGPGDTIDLTGALRLVEGLQGEDFSYVVQIPVVSLEPEAKSSDLPPMPPSFAPGATEGRPGFPGAHERDAHATISRALQVTNDKGITTTITLPDTPQAYTLVVHTTDPTPEDHSDDYLYKVERDFLLSSDTRGLMERIDVNPIIPLHHSADTNEDNDFSLGELGQVIALFTATPDHLLHGRRSERSIEVPAEETAHDGYQPGDGPHLARQHTLDYLPDSPWQLRLSELLRMFDLFNSDGGQYHRDLDNPEDGYAPGSSAGFQPMTAAAADRGTGVPPVDAASDAGPPLPGERDGVRGKSNLALAAYEAAADAAIRMDRTVTGAPTADGLLLEITLYALLDPATPLTALGLEEQLPQGWYYLGTTGGAAPGIAPAQKKTGLLEFAWFPTPAGNFQFSYQVLIPNAQDGAGLPQLQGRALYRALNKSGEGQALVEVRKGEAALPDPSDRSDPTDPSNPSPGSTTRLAASAAAHLTRGVSGVLTLDHDGDGLSDAAESQDDTDGDSIPNFLDPDSDNDGLPDSVEGAGDNDSDHKPNFLDEDAGNDGTPDGLDGGGDADADGIPDFEDRDSALPLAPWAWPGASAALLAAGCLALRRRRA